MKSYFFLFIIALSIAPCYAQSLQYHPFVEEGKVWKMKYHTEFLQYIDYPDVMCNRLIKFGAFDTKVGHDYDFIATGHYAQTEIIDGKK